MSTREAKTDKITKRIRLRCTPVWGTCKRRSGHKGPRNAYSKGKNVKSNENPVQDREVIWAKTHGFSHRISVDSNGKEYVIGDFWWNENHQISETIEPSMRRDGVYK